MSNIKKFNEFVNEGVASKVEQMILENTQEFVDQAEVTDTDISDFRQRQEEILQKYPSLSSMDKDNITNRMNSMIGETPGAASSTAAATSSISDNSSAPTVGL